MNEERVLMVGVGHLGGQIFDLLLRVSGPRSFVVGGRHLESLQARANLSRLAALQLGYFPQVAWCLLDLWNVEQAAECIAQVRPTIIVCAATLQSTESNKRFPSPLAQRMASLGMGIRLPLHLVLVYKLMQAVKLSGVKCLAVNAIYPDVVNVVLNKVGLAPTTGIGDLANNIPALRLGVASLLQQAVEAVDVRLVTARYVSYWMSRRTVEQAPLHFTALADGEEITSHINQDQLFALLPTHFRRSGGVAGLQMTAASAAVVVDALVNNTGRITHVPGPHGLPGGYPVRVSAQGVEVLLPKPLSLQTAIQINEAGLQLDGIERIDEEGTVFFSEREMALAKDVLGYTCLHMTVSDIEERAKELQARYAALAHAPG